MLFVRLNLRLNVKRIVLSSTMKTPLSLSVIIPCYNNASEIEASVASALSTLPNPLDFEVIVVDDGSTDDSYARVESLQEHHTNLALIRREQNGGPGQARNDALSVAKGTWIWFVDSDDRLASDAVRKIQGHLTQVESSCDLVFFDWLYHKASSAPIHGYEGRDDLPMLQTNDKTVIINSYLLNLIDSSVIYAVFKKALLVTESILFRPGFHEDVDFLLKAIFCSQHISCMAEPLYEKNNRLGSIVNTTTKKHIHGYMCSLKEIHTFLNRRYCFDQYAESFSAGFVNIVSSRLVRIWRAKVSSDELLRLAQCLYEESMALIQSTVGMDAILEPVEPTNTNLNTKYRQIFAFFTETLRTTREDTAERLHDFLSEIHGKYWSCFDIQHAVFFAPDEIRTCCKRFFVEGHKKGDTVLFSTSKLKNEPTLLIEDIQKAKESLVKEINRANSPECNQCPFLQFRDWPGPLSEGIKYLSLEYHSVCNMRCRYCSDTYYGGKTPAYHIQSIVENAIKNNTLEHCDYIVWGGGEPSLDKRFPVLLKNIAQATGAVKQRIITNATHFVPLLGDLLRQDKAYIVTSIDAGTEQTFYKIRQSRQMQTVLSNLQRYALAAPHNVIIKYILSCDNWAVEELTSFVENVQHYQLDRCNFQISYDFNEAQISDQGLAAIAQLYGMLSRIHVRFIFLDDLIWQRMPPIGHKTYSFIKTELAKHGFQDCLVAEDIKQVIVWGTGSQADLLIRKTRFFKQTSVMSFVDPRETVVGSQFHGKPVFSPEHLKETDLPVVIAAVQSAPHIYSQFLKLSIEESRLINSLIL